MPWDCQGLCSLRCSPQGAEAVPPCSPAVLPAPPHWLPWTGGSVGWQGRWLA